MKQHQTTLGKNQESKFSFIDLFAGIGGLRRGFVRIGGQCIYTGEWDKYAQQTYRANYEDDHEIAGEPQQLQVFPGDRETVACG